MLTLGIDLGGTKILAGVVSSRGKVLSRAKTPTPFADGEAALGEAILATAAEALALAAVPAARLAAVGIGSPGPLDPDRGLVLRTPNIAVENLRVSRLLARRFRAPVLLDNDVNMALFGEFRAGTGRGFRNLVGVWVGTGIGGGVIVDGKIVRGANKNAGEIGHMILDARRAKRDGRKSTLEWEASKTGIARLLGKHLRKGERLDSSDLGKAFRSGNPRARRAVEHSARFVGIAIANLFDVLSPEIFILGGGIVEDLGRAYVSAVRKTARQLAFSTELATVRVEASRLGSDAGVVGAALAAQERFTA